MRRLVFGTIIVGTTFVSLAGAFLGGCESAPPIGGETPIGGGGGMGGGTGFGLKFDASVSGQGASGGAGATGTDPTSEANCGSQTSKTTKQPPDVLLLIDRSGSMEYSIADDCNCSASGGNQVCADTANCTTRWNAIRPAVKDTVTKAADVNWGLKFFPTGSQQCSVSNAMEVQIKAGNGAAVQAQLESATLGTTTPTAAALKTATDYLKNVTDSNPKFILLATDGEPNCGGNPAKSSNADLEGATSAAAAAYAAGFPVYVIGIGPELANLSQLAKAGGTTDYYKVSSPEQLANAFASISKLVASCTFALNSLPPDVNSIAVYLDKNLVSKNDTNGWSLAPNGKSIEFHGSVCEKITSGSATSVEVLFGCASPPSVIP